MMLQPSSKVLCRVLKSKFRTAFSQFTRFFFIYGVASINSSMTNVQISNYQIQFLRNFFHEYRRILQCKARFFCSVTFERSPEFVASNLYRLLIFLPLYSGFWFANGGAEKPCGITLGKSQGTGFHFYQQWLFYFQHHSPFRFSLLIIRHAHVPAFIFSLYGFN